jgi:hypothetical protein
MLLTRIYIILKQYGFNNTKNKTWWTWPGYSSRFSPFVRPAFNNNNIYATVNEWKSKIMPPKRSLFQKSTNNKAIGNFTKQARNDKQVTEKIVHELPNTYEP